MKRDRKRRIRSKNVGNIDSMIRVVLGAVILIVGFLFENFWGLVGLIPLLSGAVGWCPVYRLLGVSTCRRDLELEV